MPARAVIQPNGLYARFSTVCDHFTDYNCTREEIWIIFRNESGSDSADGKVQRADEHPERFEDECETIELVHGKEEADKVRALLSKPQDKLFPKPLDELDLSRGRQMGDNPAQDARDNYKLLRRQAAEHLLRLAGVDMAEVDWDDELETYIKNNGPVQ